MNPPQVPSSSSSSSSFFCQSFWWTLLFLIIWYGLHIHISTWSVRRESEVQWERTREQQTQPVQSRVRVTLKIAPKSPY